jgi:hypothetical protein
VYYVWQARDGQHPQDEEENAYSRESMLTLRGGAAFDPVIVT